MALTPSDGIASAAVLAAANLPYKRGQEVIETDTGKVKIGDGTTRYNALPYLTRVNDADLTWGVGTGPVVTDSSDGHTYRLGTTAGVVTATQVT